MHDLGRPHPVRQIEGDHLDVGERRPECRDSGRARAVAMADEERVVIEPDRVASLDRCGSGHGRGDRHSGGFEAQADARRLAEAALLARPEKRCATVTDEHRVVDVDRIRVARVVLRDDHLGACRLE